MKLVSRSILALAIVFGAPSVARANGVTEWLSALLGEPAPRALKVGEKARLKQTMAPSRGYSAEHPPRILMTILVGGEPVNFSQDWELEIFAGENTGAAPAYKFNSAQLAASPQTTGCDSASVDVLKKDAFEGQALFCDGSIELARLGSFELKKAGDRTKTATSYFVNFQRQDLVAITVWIH